MSTTDATKALPQFFKDPGAPAITHTESNLYGRWRENTERYPGNSAEPMTRLGSFTEASKRSQISSSTNCEA